MITVFRQEEKRKIEAERLIFVVCRLTDAHLSDSKIAHTSCLCAAFQPLQGSIFVSERLTYAQKEAPHEKKALTFFHADIPF